MHARDISDAEFLLAVERIQREFKRPAQVDELHLTLGAPTKVVRAKGRRLIRRLLLSGCTCGCRGDFRVRGLDR